MQIMYLVLPLMSMEDGLCLNSWRCSDKIGRKVDDMTFGAGRKER